MGSNPTAGTSNVFSTLSLERSTCIIRITDTIGITMIMDIEGEVEGVLDGIRLSECREVQPVCRIVRISNAGSNNYCPFV